MASIYLISPTLGRVRYDHHNPQHQDILINEFPDDIIERLRKPFINERARGFGGDFDMSVFPNGHYEITATTTIKYDHLF